MRELALGQSPARSQILLQVLRPLDGGNDRLVEISLVDGLPLRQGLLLLLLSTLKELSFRRPGGLCGGFGEVCIVEFIVDLQR